MNLVPTRLLAWVLCLAPAAAGPQDPPPRPAPAPAAGERADEPARTPELGLAPRKPIAGLTGFRARSTLTFEGLPDQPHALEAVFAFPGRVRWEISSKGPAGFRRAVDYRLGERAFALPEAGAAALPYLAPDREIVLRRMELRLATLLWPEAAAWERRPGDPDSIRIAPLADAPGAPPLGSLRAELDQRGLPKRVAVLDPAGQEQESLTVLSWSEQFGRKWPASLELRAAGTLVWTERLESIDPRVELPDSYFRPHGLEEAGGDAARPGGEGSDARVLDLPEMIWRSFPLAEEGSWEAWCAQARAIHAEQARLLARADLQLEEGLAFELDDRAQPRAVVLRVAGAPREPPAGWSHAGRRRGASLFVRSLSEIDAGRLARLRELLPAEGKAGRPYARVFSLSDMEAEPGKPGRFQVVLPFEPPA